MKHPIVSIALAALASPAPAGGGRRLGVAGGAAEVRAAGAGA